MASVSRSIRRNIVAPVRWLRRREWHRKVAVPRIETELSTGAHMPIERHATLTRMRSWLAAFDLRQAAKKAAREARGAA